LAETIDYEIIHSLAGRLRLRVAAIFRDQSLAGGLAELVSCQKGVMSARVNADCAALCISFEPLLFDPIAWLKQLRLLNNGSVIVGAANGLRPLFDEWSENEIVSTN